jgi:hypothetical protein
MMVPIFQNDALDLAEFARRWREAEPTAYELQAAEELAARVHRALAASLAAKRAELSEASNQECP